MKNHKNRSFLKLGLGVLVFIALSAFSYAQNLTGPNPVEIGDTETYVYNDGTLKSNTSWEITGGTLNSSSSSGTAYSVVVQWNTLGTGGVTFKDRHGNPIETLLVLVEQGAPPPTLVTELNYVHNITPRIETTDITTLGTDEKIEAISYFDGLGRAKQQVAIRAGGNSEDIITPIVYDAFGRNIKEYLPYSSTTDIGTYRVDALSDVHTFYDASAYEDDFPSMSVNDINPYSEKSFDNSPLNRVMKQAAPGKDWKMGNGHEIEMDYDTNTTNEVRLYSVSLAKNTSNNVVTYYPTLQTNGYYPINELYKTITKDENHDGSSTKDHTTEEFKNKQGQVVLKRTYNNEVAHDTYYVYDDYGNLGFVLPPKSEPHAVKPDGTELNLLCYQYTYDDLNRLVEKKIPGKGWEFIVYNKLDQPIMTQDANLKTQNRWLFTKYDVFGRVAFTGLMASGSNRKVLQNSANATTLQWVTKSNSSTTIAGTTVYYSNGSSVYPNFGMDKVYTINYYDNYVFDLGSGFSQNAYGVWPITNPKGLATGSKVRVLDTNDWITTVSYYDDKSRPLYVYSHNEYLGTTDKVKSQLTFDGRVTETTTTHDRLGTLSTTIVDKYEYDHTNRLKSHKQKMNAAALDEVIVSNVYDDLGQLKIKGVGGKQNILYRLQDIDYEYNIRGWLKTINNPLIIGNDLFAFKISYDKPDFDPSTTGLFNGNISETHWITANDNTNRNYRYSYDDLNRITQAINIGPSENNRYEVTGITYDKNGNLLTLNRNGHTNTNATTFGTMDDLVYTYETKSNQLKKVLDNGNATYGFKDGSNMTTEYTYDTNGNMLEDKNKDISRIDYNHLNLPVRVTIVNKDIDYIYDATGVKQKKIVNIGTGTTTEYAGNFIYENGILKMFSHPEGYAEPTGKSTKLGASYNYVYQYKDHLGNIRLTYADSNYNGNVDSSEIIEENNYYPFGLKHKGYNGNVSANVNSVASKFKFNGIELEESLGLNLYEMEFRNYDPAIGRFAQIDPLSEGYYSWSGYNFSGNNPILYRDPDGLNWLNADGQVVYDSEKGEYTKHATDQDKLYGDALRNSGENGLKVFNHLVNSKTQITVNFSDETFVSDTSGYQLGETQSTEEGKNFHYDENGEIVVDNAVINVYIGSIEAFTDRLKNDSDFSTEALNDTENDNVNTIINENLSSEDVTTSTFGHEIVHTMPYNVKLQLKENRGENMKGNHSEFYPTRVEGKILKDIAKKKKAKN